jgi:hypothetical protein
MASATVSRSALYDGNLPHTCVVTGQPADGTVDVRFNSLPSWTWILLLFGVFPFLIASAFASERVVGAVPVVREAVVRFHRRRRLSTVLLVAGVFGWMYAAWAHVGWLLWPFVALTVAGVAGWVWAYFSFVDGRPVRGGTQVRLSRVHPDFAAAVEEKARQ